jgi:four helix bundle protein
MVAKRFEELICWQLSHELHLEVLAFAAIAPASKDWKYRGQIRDSSSSGPSNIAEGFGRFRPTEFGRFLDIARASLLETQNHLKDGLARGYLDVELFRRLDHLANRAVGATTKLRLYRRSCPDDGPWNRSRRRR